MKQYLKFTFDIDKVFNNSKEFSQNNLHMCKIDYDRLITQKELYEYIDKKYINTETSKGFCTLVSIYNAFPDLFDDFEDFVCVVERILEKTKKFSSLKSMSNVINIIKGKKLLFDENNLQESYRITCDNINKNKPVVISYTYLFNILLDNRKYSQHTVAIFGYDDSLIYYKENSETDYLFMSLASYIIDYYGINPIKEDNPEKDRLKQLLHEENESNCIKLAKDILGYNIGQNGIKTLKKNFLTNGKFFYDLNRLITYIGNVPLYDNNINTNYCEFRLSELTKRLNKINF